MDFRSAKILSNSVNQSVVQMPERRFPGVVVQGDPLKILVDDVEELSDVLKKQPHTEAHDLTTHLLSKLRTLQSHYEITLKEAGIELPYPN